MAGLFELQLPRESRQRRSNDAPDPRQSTARARSRSPAPNVTAKEIVRHLVAKQQNVSTASVSSSIFPWRRRATGVTDSSRQSHDSTSRTSLDTSARSTSQSPGGALSNKPLPRRPHTGSSASPSSARGSSSIDFTLASSTRSASSVFAAKDDPPNATSALAQAGLGLSVPPIAFPGSPPVLKPPSGKRKGSRRPGTAHGYEGTSKSDSSLNVRNVRRVTSFSKHEGSLDVGQRDKPLSGTPVGNSGDVLVFLRERTSVAPHAYSMPEHSSGNSTLQKGKERQRTSDVDVNSSQNTGVDRGRQATTLPVLRIGDRDKSATRRASWWPGRRRLDSSPIDAKPPPMPPPIPTRSSGRNTPLLPSFRPFSPLMDDFGMTDSPKLKATYLEDNGDRLSHPPDVAMGLGQKESVVVRRRHSLTSRTARENINTPSHTSSQTYSPSHRYSHSFTTDQSNFILNTPTSPRPSTHLDRPSHSEPTPGSKTRKRHRSMTLNSPPVSTPSNRETPLLLRQPINRPNFSAEPPDPFLSGRATNKGSPVNADVGNLFIDSADIGPTPSTSSGSTSSLSQSASTTNRPPRQRPGIALPASRTLTTSTSFSLPPPTSSHRLLRRLSSTFFSSSSAVGSPIEPGAVNPPSLLLSGAKTSSTPSNTSSPGLSKENLAVPDGSRSSVDGWKRRSRKPPLKVADETPDEYLSRLVEAVSKAEVVHVLAARCEF